MEHFELALPYREMIVGIGLDSNEFDRPPKLFLDLYARARADGFKLTAHCDVKQPATHENIRQVVEELGGTGAERIDHGLDAAERPEFVKLIKEKGYGMTLCKCRTPCEGHACIPVHILPHSSTKEIPILIQLGPWAYVRHRPEADLFAHMNNLKDAGIRICISSDSPAYVESNWVTDNLALLKLRGGYTNEDIIKVQRDAIDMCWASEEEKAVLRQEIDAFVVKMRSRDLLRQT